MARFLYERVTAELRRRIEAGEFRVGDALPTISQMEDWLGSRGVQTVRDGYQPLIDEGLVESQRDGGRRRYVLAAMPVTDPVQRLAVVEESIECAQVGLAKALAQLRELRRELAASGVSGGGYGPRDQIPIDGDDDGTAHIHNPRTGESREPVGRAGGGAQ